LLKISQFYVTGPYVHFEAIPKELKLQGFLVNSYHKRFEEALTDLNKWIDEVTEVIFTLKANIMSETWV